MVVLKVRQEEGRKYKTAVPDSDIANRSFDFWGVAPWEFYIFREIAFQVAFYTCKQRTCAVLIKRIKLSTLSAIHIFPCKRFDFIVDIAKCDKNILAGF